MTETETLAKDTDYPRGCENHTTRQGHWKVGERMEGSFDSPSRSSSRLSRSSSPLNSSSSSESSSESGEEVGHGENENFSRAGSAMGVGNQPEVLIPQGKGHRQMVCDGEASVAANVGGAVSGVFVRRPPGYEYSGTLIRQGEKFGFLDCPEVGLNENVK